MYDMYDMYMHQYHHGEEFDWKPCEGTGKSITLHEGWDRGMTASKFNQCSLFDCYPVRCSVGTL